MRDPRTLDGYVTPARTKVLLALIAVHNRDGRATVRSVAAEAGRNVSTTFFHLRHLKAAGLVESTAISAGTLRPLVEVVAHG